MQSLFEHVGIVVDADSLDDAVAEIENALKTVLVMYGSSTFC